MHIYNAFPRFCGLLDSIFRFPIAKGPYISGLCALVPYLCLWPLVTGLPDLMALIGKLNRRVQYTDSLSVENDLITLKCFLFLSKWNPCGWGLWTLFVSSWTGEGVWVGTIKGFHPSTQMYIVAMPEMKGPASLLPDWSLSLHLELLLALGSCSERG